MNARMLIPAAVLAALSPAGPEPRQARSAIQDDRLGSAELAPPPPPGPEAAIIAELRRPGNPHERQMLLVRRLGYCRDRPAAVRELIVCIHMLDINEHWHNGRSEAQSIILPEEMPAIEALGRIGPFAAPFLVDKYVSVHDGTPDRAFSPYQQYMLNWLALALTIARDRDPALAQAAVKYALRRKADQPKDEKVQKACDHLIEGVVGQFRYHDQLRLFPPEALPKE